MKEPKFRKYEVQSEKGEVIKTNSRKEADRLAEKASHIEGATSIIQKGKGDEPDTVIHTEPDRRPQS